jgi:hypothetical protein
MTERDPMPALPDAPAVIRIDHHFKIGEDSQAKCRLFYKYGGTAPSNADLAAFSANVHAQFGLHLAGEMTSDRNLEILSVTDLTSPTSAFGQDSLAVPGTNGGGSLPADVCVLEKFTLARRYRGGHPRVYWPFFSEAELNDAQTWKSTPLGTLETNMANYEVGIQASVWAGGGTLQAVSVSYYAGFTTHTGTTGRVKNVSTVRPVTVIDPLTSFSFATGIASQRKRLLRLA